MRRARSVGLAFVPAVIAAADGRDHVELAGELWDLTEWLPGVADFHSNPSPIRLEAAAAALARVHAAWEQLTPSAPDVCPALLRRLEAAAGWQDLRRSGWQPRWQAIDIDPVRPVAERACGLIDRRVVDVAVRLHQWVDRRWRLQPCLCDVWHDHLLFEGDRLTGLIDYGAAKVDHPAVDVARMLGSLVPDDPSAWQVGLRAYRGVRPFGEGEIDLARALDETGTTIGVATWLRWLYEENRPFEDHGAVARRLDALVGRLERWDG
jgi:homoserine kinase type II